MERICAVCGTGFSAKTIRAKYCSSRCKNQSRYAVSISAYLSRSQFDKDSAVLLYDSDKSVAEIAKLLGRSAGFVYSAWHEAGLNKRYTKQQLAVKRLREEGKCCSEISDILGIRTSTINATVKVIGLPFTEKEKERSVQLGKQKTVKAQTHSDEWQRAFMAEFHPTFDFVSGNINSDGFVQIRHRSCGTEFQKSAITIRKKSKLQCPYCIAEEKKQKYLEKELQAKAKQEEHERAFWSQDFSQQTLIFKACKCCGTSFVGNRSCYCSDKCAKKMMNRHHDNRLKRAEIRDSTITLEKLYKKDGGKCWLCGGLCDYEDCFTDKNKNFVVGATYPSIDHVLPLSKGGQHTWDNVRLAHHYCNTLKNDKVVC